MGNIRDYNYDMKSLLSQNKNKELINAISEIKRLRGIIPICASCKKIRDDSGFWHQVEVYVRDHSEAIFSHGVCPDCEKKLYPDFFNKDKSRTSLESPEFKSEIVCISENPSAKLLFHAGRDHFLDIRQCDLARDHRYCLSSRP